MSRYYSRQYSNQYNQGRYNNNYGNRNYNNNNYYDNGDNYGYRAGTDVMMGGKKLVELYIKADNLLDCAYQHHLNRLKYADVNSVTGRRGVFNLGRNITFKVVVPIKF